MTPGKRKAILPRVTAPDGLTDKQRKFFERYLEHGEKRRAAIEAGYSEAGAAVEASRMLKNPKFSVHLKKVEEKVAATIAAHTETVAGIVVDRVWVVGEMLKLYQRSVQAVPVTDAEGKPTGEWRYRDVLAQRILEFLGKDVGVGYERATPEEIASWSIERLQAEARRARLPERMRLMA